MRILFDMDGVLAKYLFGKPFEALFEKGYFADLPPQTSFVEAAKKLSEMYEVRVLSAYLEDSKYAYEEKQNWLRKYLPELPEEKWILIPCGIPKGNYLESKDDILIDDWGENCKSWNEVNGRFFKVSASAADARKEMSKWDYVLHPEMTADEIVKAVQDRINEELVKKAIIEDMKNKYHFNEKTAEVVYNKANETNHVGIYTRCNEFAKFAEKVIEANGGV
jgi:5'(3')-deoxyribonucleotidase